MYIYIKRDKTWYSYIFMYASIAKEYCIKWDVTFDYLKDLFKKSRRETFIN